MVVTNGSSFQWKVKFLETAEKQFRKLDRKTQQDINHYIFERLETKKIPGVLVSLLLGI